MQNPHTNTNLFNSVYPFKNDLPFSELCHRLFLSNCQTSCGDSRKLLHPAKKESGTQPRAKWQIVVRAQPLRFRELLVDRFCSLCNIYTKGIACVFVCLYVVVYVCVYVHDFIVGDHSENWAIGHLHFGITVHTISVKKWRKSRENWLKA